MLRILLCALMISSLSFSCSSKKKQDDEAAGLADTGVEEQAMTFDPRGSDSGNIPGLSSVNFEYDQARLTTEARRILAENADWIKTNTNTTVQVEGHCDERGSIEYNLSLGERRARSVKQYLVSLGIEPSRLTIISYGEEKPLVTGDTEEAFATNRRANFVPLPN